MAGTSRIFVFNENISDQKIIISGGREHSTPSQCLDKRQEAKHYHFRPRLTECLYRSQLLRFCSIVVCFYVLYHLDTSSRQDWKKASLVSFDFINRRK